MIFKSPTKRIFFEEFLVAILVILLWNGRYSGLGTNLIDSSFGIGAGKIYYYDWILKILLTVLTLSIGFQGGEVTPLFAIGLPLGLYSRTIRITSNVSSSNRLCNCFWCCNK